MSAWTLHLGDCIEGLKTLADKSVDHVICDPPFSQETSQNARRNRNKSLGRDGRFIEFDGIDPADIVPHLIRVARRWIIAACALEQLGDYKRASGDAWVRSGIWNKEDGAPQFTGDRPAQSAEGIAVMHVDGAEGIAIMHPADLRKRWNAGGKRGVWSGGVEKKAREIGHPTPKPMWLMEAIIRDFTDPGDLILDPFTGSGTTGIAAVRLGRRFVGWERDEKYHAIASERIGATREQIDLFDGAKPRKIEQLGMAALLGDSPPESK